MKFVPFALGDRVRLRKPHPCGSYEWEVYRLGADIGLKCQGCGRHVLLPRSEVERRLKHILSHAPSSQDTPAEDTPARNTPAKDTPHRGEVR
jgi:hypothetical protein